MTKDHTYRGYDVDVLYMGSYWQAWFSKRDYWPTWTTGECESLDEVLEVVHAQIDDLYLPEKLRQLSH